MNVSVCPVCGNAFPEDKRHHKKILLRRMSKKAEKEREKNRIRVRPKKKTGLSAAEINKKARDVGLTYGKYVARYGV